MHWTVPATARPAGPKFAVHGLSGEWRVARWTIPKVCPQGEPGGVHPINQENTHLENIQDSGGRFDFLLATPPFHGSKIDKEHPAGNPRYPFGIPRTDNRNYRWTQHLHSAPLSFAVKTCNIFTS